jgi:hypothetical protein
VPIHPFQVFGADFEDGKGDFDEEIDLLTLWDETGGASQSGPSTCTSSCVLSKVKYAFLATPSQDSASDEFPSVAEPLDS